jgi:hypothetical protein
MDEPKANALNEIAAMKVVAEALAALDEGGVRRVLRWAHDAFAPKAVAAVEVAPAAVPAPSSNARTNSEPDGVERHETLADFYSAADPQQDSDRALVVGYWVQVIEGEGDFDSFAVNKRLKDLGYGVGNITSAFNGLISRRPQLVIQTKKSGTSKQARKLYRLTSEGQKTVERMTAVS